MIIAEARRVGPLSFRVIYLQAANFRSGADGVRERRGIVMQAARCVGVLEISDLDRVLLGTGAVAAIARGKW